MYPSSFSTLAIATLTPDDGIWTVAFSASCALRMRVSMSAIGSLMLMVHLTCLVSCLPTRLDDARNLSAHRDLAQLVAPESELAKHAARPAGELAPVAQPRRTRIARQLLHLASRRLPLLVGNLEVAGDREQLGALFRVFLHRQPALLVAIDNSRFRHGFLSLSLVLERKFERREQRSRLRVALRRRRDRDVHAPDRVD